jgi:hypothetical protein
MTEPGYEFETFLKTRTLLPNGMSDDEDKLEPPKALDAIVLKEAREAIRARQQVNRTPRWATPVALAATILLCLSIVLNVSLNTNRPAANPQRMAAATADKASPPSASPVPESQRTEDAPGGGASNEVILPEAKIVEQREARLVAQAAQGPSETAPAADSAADKAPQLAGRASTAAQAQSESQSGANAAPDRAPQVADRRSTAAPGQSEAQSAATDSVTTLAARGLAGNGAAVSPYATRDPAVAAAPAPIGGIAEPQRRDQPALAKPKIAAATAPHPQDPKTWLQQIADLRAEGKTEQADTEMRRFRAAFPAYSPKPTPAAPTEPLK